MQSNYTLLVVDDETRIVDMIEKWLSLKGNPNYTVLRAVDGEDGLRVFNESQGIDILMTDQKMPNMQGLDLIRICKEKKRDLITILFTGYQDMDVVIEALNSGLVNRYIAKPFNLKELDTILIGEIQKSEMFYENLRLNIQLKEYTIEIEEMASTIVAIYDFSRNILSGSSLDELLSYIFKRVIKDSKAKSASLLFFREEKDEDLHIEKGFNISDEIIKRMKAKLAAETMNWIMTSRMPILGLKPIGDPNDYYYYLVPYKEGEMDPRSISLPVIVGSKLKGVLNLTRNSEGEAFRENDHKKLFIFASAIGIAIENANLHHQTMIKQRENAELLERLKNVNIELEERVKVRTEDLNKSNRFKSFLISYMSHEFRTPLNSIISFSQNILDTSENLDKRHRDDVEIIYGSGENLLKLINDVLEYSRLSSNKVELYSDYVKIETIIETVIMTLTQLAKKKGLVLTFNKRGEIPIFQADSRKVTQIITNIIGNAIKFTDKGGIEIQSDFVDMNAFISVRDTGIGVKTEDLPYIFDEYTQLSGRSLVPGTGLGMAITKQFVELHGGKIWVESKYGEGSVFHFTLPVKGA